MEPGVQITCGLTNRKRLGHSAATCFPTSPIPAIEESSLRLAELSLPLNIYKRF